jgi:hypothetical protein
MAVSTVRSAGDATGVRGAMANDPTEDRPRRGVVGDCLPMRNLLLELCFPQLGQSRQSIVPFGKIENDAL